MPLAEGRVPREVVEELIELATCAPNHRLTEPWRFTIVEGDGLEHLGRFWGARTAAKAEPAQRDKIIDNEVRKLKRAPLVIVVSTRTADDPEMAEEDFAATAAAVENILVAAHARGLAAMWRTGKMVHDPEVKRYLGLDPSDRIVASIYLGHTALAEAKPMPRQLTSVIRWIDGAQA
ncbi:MAG TPA: nitroreductase [Candidatus Binataceae bacterium]|nr:nitroreductase [Candidatus Binataceae bacterium]